MRIENIQRNILVWYNGLFFPHGELLKHPIDETMLSADKDDAFGYRMWQPKIQSHSANILRAKLFDLPSLKDTVPKLTKLEHPGN